MYKFIVAFDTHLITFLKKIYQPVARISLFVVFTWFGFLKIIDQSAANELVAELLSYTLPSISFETFFILLGSYEILLGIFFLIPKTERVAVAMLIPHFLVTTLALIIVPGITWNGFLMPTMEGQYIIKNIIIVALALSIAAQLQPLKLDKQR